MPNEPTVPMYAPDGTLGDVPYSKMHDALQAGGKLGVNMLAPDGTHGVIPADKVAEASKAGGKTIPFDLHDADGAKPGFWSSMGSTLKGMVTPSGVSPYPGMDEEGKMALAIQSRQQDAQRKAAGYSKAYRIAAPLAESLGVDAPGMEQSAAAGDTSGVIGHAAGSAAPVVAGAAAGAVTDAARRAVPVAKDVAAKLYQGALKPPPGSYTLPEVNRIVQTGLENKIPVSSAGVERLTGLISDLNQKVRDQIETGSKAGATVNKYSVASRLADTSKKFSTQVNPEADLAAIGTSGNEFLRNQPTEIPAVQAQDLKTGTYKQLKDRAYGELGSATIESQKALARGIKEELASQFPEIGAMNAKESRFIGLDGALERAVRRINNHDIVSLGDKVVAGAGAIGGAAASGGPGAVAGAAASAAIHHVLMSPEVRSKIAIRLNQVGVPWNAAQARVGAYLSSLAASSASPNQSQEGGTQ